MVLGGDHQRHGQLRGFGRLGGDLVDADAHRPQLQCQALGEAADGGLEGGIDAAIGNTAESFDGRQADDAAARPAAAQQWQHGAGHAEDVLQVDRVETVDVVIAVGIERLGDHQRITDIVDQHVEPAEARFDLFSQRGHLGAIGDIGLYHQRLATLAGQPVAQGSGTLAIHLGDRQPGASTGEGFDHGPPDAHTATGHQDGLACKIDHFVVLFLLLWERIHSPRAAQLPPGIVQGRPSACLANEFAPAFVSPEAWMCSAARKPKTMAGPMVEPAPG
ncbi:hypothetical protein D9M68_713130 [compost metagenome]